MVKSKIAFYFKTEFFSYKAPGNPDFSVVK